MRNADVETIRRRPSRGRVRILLTGFGRFPGAPSNPSASIVAKIAHAGKRRLERCGIELATAILPVDFAEIGAALADRLAVCEPDAVLHLGLAARRPVLTVEARARNRLSQLHPDAAKRRAAGPAVIAGAAECRKVRLPVGRIAVAMNRTGAPTRLSNDAGSYLCNAALYHTLGTPIPLAGFIHVPCPRPANRPALRRGTAPVCPSLAAMVAAITAALLFVGAQARRNRRCTIAGTDVSCATP